MAATWPVGGGAASLTGKMVGAGLQSAAAGQLAPTSAEESRIGRAATDFALGGVFSGIGEKIVGPAIGAVAKYSPIKTKAFAEKQAIADLNEWANLSPTKMEALTQKSREVFGDTAEFINLPQLAEGPTSVALSNIERTLAQSSDPKLAQKIMSRRAAQDKALNAAVESLRRVIPLQEGERELGRATYSNLNSIKLKPDAYEDLLNNTKLQDIMRDVYGRKFDVTEAGQLSFPIEQAGIGYKGQVVPPAFAKDLASTSTRKPYADLRRTLAGYDSNSVAFWDQIKREVDSTLYGSRDLGDAERRALQDLRTRLVRAMDTAAEGSVDYQRARALSQREIIGRQLDEMFTKAPEVRTGVGEYAPSAQGVKTMFTRGNWKGIEEALSGIQDKDVKKKALYHANLIRDLSMSLEAEDAYKQVGKSFSATTEPPTIARAVAGVGNFLRGDYNMAIAEVLHNPNKYNEVIQKIAKDSKTVQDRRRALVTLLTQVQNDIAAQEEAVRRGQQ